MYKYLMINNIMVNNLLSRCYYIPSSLLHRDTLTTFLKESKYIPYHKRYETLDFYPKPIVSTNILKYYKKNDIPFHERYETIDFIPLEDIPKIS